MVVAKCVLLVYPAAAVQHQSTTALALVVLTVLLSLPLAMLTYRYVELPGIAIGKRVWLLLNPAQSVRDKPVPSR